MIWIDKAIGVQPFRKRNIFPFGLSHLLPYVAHGERRVTKPITAQSCRKNDGTPIALSKQLGLLTERHNLYVTLMQGNQMDKISFVEQCAKAEREIDKLRTRRNKPLSEDEDERNIDDIRTLRNKRSLAPKAILRLDFELFDAVVEKVIVEDDSKVSFVLYCGLKLREAIAWN